MRALVVLLALLLILCLIIAWNEWQSRRDIRNKRRAHRRQLAYANDESISAIKRAIEDAKLSGDDTLVYFLEQDLKDAKTRVNRQLKES
jgi:hypothetical protein